VARLQGIWRGEHCLSCAKRWKLPFVAQMAVCESWKSGALAKVIVPVVQNRRSRSAQSTRLGGGREEKSGFISARGEGLKRDLSANWRRFAGDLTQVTRLTRWGDGLYFRDWPGHDRWRDRQSLFPWLGLCPGNKITEANAQQPHPACGSIVGHPVEDGAPSVGGRTLGWAAFIGGCGRLGRRSQHRHRHKLATLVYICSNTKRITSSGPLALRSQTVRQAPGSPPKTSGRTWLRDDPENASRLMVTWSFCTSQTRALTAGRAAPARR